MDAMWALKKMRTFLKQTRTCAVEGNTVCVADGHRSSKGRTDGPALPEPVDIEREEETG